MRGGKQIGGVGAAALLAAVGALTAIREADEVAYGIGFAFGFMCMSILLAIAARFVYTRFRGGEVMDPSILLLASMVGIAVSISMAVADDDRSLDDQTELLRESGEACRANEPDPLVGAGDLDFVSVPAAQLDQLLAAAPDVLQGGAVEAATVTVKGTPTGSVLLVPGLTEGSARAGFLAGARGGVTNSGGTATDSTVAGSPVLVASVPRQFTSVLGFSGCYGFAAYALDRPMALRIAERVLLR